MNEFEIIEKKSKIVKETEKAVAVAVGGYVGSSSCGYDTSKIKWLPKSVVKIENDEVVAIKGWFIDKECGEFWELVSKEAVDRFEAKHCKKAV